MLPPDTCTDVSRLFAMHQGIFHTRLLHEGIRLKIFDHLTSSVTPTQLARRLGLHPQSTLHFLRGLTSEGLTEQDNGTFQNSWLSQRYLVTHSESYIGDYLASHARWNLEFFENMDDILRHGPPERTIQADDETIWAREAEALINLQRTCTGPVLSKAVAALPGFASFSRMLDLGGGPGQNALSVLHAHPSMTGVLFDRPAVVRVAQEQIRRDGMEHRLTTMQGNFGLDDFGQGYDLIVATACLNFIKDDLDNFMTRVLDALTPGGVFLSIHDGLTHDRTRPKSIALSWLPISMGWQELGLERGELAAAMQTAGFTNIQSRPVAYGISEMDLDTGVRP